ncbi:MAG TPA: TolC family protein [Myxococcales bacterium]
MSRASLLVLAVGLAGCAAFAPRPPVGPQPLPEAWRPEVTIRERIVAKSSGEIVLNDKDGLSPDVAAVMALDRNPRLRAIRAERGIARAEIISAGILPNPRLDGTLTFPVAGDATVLGFGGGVTWNVTPLIARGPKVEAAEESSRSVDLEVAWQEWQVAQVARLGTVRAIFLERRIAVARAAEQSWRERLDALRKASEARAVTDLDVASAERSLAEARVGRLELQQKLASERVSLNQAIGLDPGATPALDASWSSAGARPALAGLLDGLPQRRLDLLALQHAARSNDQAERAAVLSQFPPVELGVHAAREVDGVGSAGVSLTFDVPFFDRSQGNVAREHGRRLQLEAEYDARLADARADVVRAEKEIELVVEQLVAAKETAAAASRLAEQARGAATGGALSPILAAEAQDRSLASQLRVLEIEGTLAELEVARSLASGTH